MIIHVVEQDETLSSIATLYGVTREALLNYNQLPNPNALVVGQTILVFYPRQRYTVQDGDTLVNIAEKNGISVIQLLQRNPQLISREILYTGEVLVIEFDEEPLGNIELNGYVYPYVNREILKTSLPYLTFLTIFGYGFDLEGNLTTIDDEPLIELARGYRTAPVMLLSSVSADGVFNSYLASVMMNNEELQDNLLSNVVVVMQEKGYVGLDIDFEFVPQDDREGYIAFLRKAVEVLHEYGYFVHVDLAPKSSADQKGLLYEAHDYAAIGEIVDQVLVMTYEWGYTYSIPMAVAPINQVRRVMDYAVSEIPLEKIFMGIPNYGYDWTLPYEKGRAARSVGNVEAIELAAEYRAEIEYDTLAQTPYYYYQTAEEVNHVVWFEDTRSIEAKLKLISELKVTGAGYWNVMKPFPQNWMMAGQMFRIRKLL